MEALLKTLISRYFLFSSVLFGASSFFLAQYYNFSLELAVTGSTVVTLIFAMYFESVIPYRKQWNQNQGDTKTDITSAIVLVGVADPLLKYLAPILVVWFYTNGLDSQSTGLFTHLGFGFQLFAVILLAEFGRYWAHRAHHLFRHLWWLHAMHHSSKRLYAINNMRFNPLNYMINFAAGVLPVMLLGFSSEALLAYMAITQPVLMLQHANIDLKSGFLNHVFSTNEVHRWHHSTKADEANVNFGNAFVFWDQLFGTFKAPGFSVDQAVGLYSTSTNYPSNQGYFTQLRSMFMPSCCAA